MYEKRKARTGEIEKDEKKCSAPFVCKYKKSPQIAAIQGYIYLVTKSFVGMPEELKIEGMTFLPWHAFLTGNLKTSDLPTRIIVRLRLSLTIRMIHPIDLVYRIHEHSESFPQVTMNLSIYQCFLY